MVEVKVKKLNYTRETEWVKVPLIDPDALMGYLLKSGLAIPEEQVIEIWEKKRMAGEKWALFTTASNRHIPIAIYGDSCRLVTTRRESKYLGIFLSLPLWRPRSTRYSRWCIFSLENSKLYGQQTLRPVLQRIVYKLNMLFEHGVEGSDGQTVRFACTEIRGDWEWRKQLFNLTSSWKSISNVCFRCDCKARSCDPKKLYHCLDDDPSWREFDLAEFLATQIQLDGGACTFFKLVTFSRNFCFVQSLMFPTLQSKVFLIRVCCLLFGSSILGKAHWSCYMDSIQCYCKYVQCMC